MKPSDENPHRGESAKQAKRRWVTLPAFPALLKRTVTFRLTANGLTAPTAVRASPTMAIYFCDPLRHLIDATGQHGARPIRQLTATLFATGRDAVIIRYGGAEEIAQLVALRPEQGLLCDRRRSSRGGSGRWLARRLPAAPHCLPRWTAAGHPSPCHPCGGAIGGDSRRLSRQARICRSHRRKSISQVAWRIMR